MFKYRLYHLIVLFICSSLQCCKSSIHKEESDTSLFTKTVPIKLQPLKPVNITIYEAAIGGDLGPCEPSIFINSTNTDELVAGSLLNFSHYSRDGGCTWNTQKLKSSLGVWGDPVITADKEGSFYYFHLSDPEGTNWGSSKILDRIVVQKSTDAGATWSDGIGIGHNPPKQQDKQWATTNPSTGDLYVTWTEFDKYGSTKPDDASRIQFSNSADGGTTWSTPVTINQFNGNCKDDDATVEGAVPSSDGTNIYVAWAYNNKIWFDYSTDNGRTWQNEDIIIASQKSGWDFTIPGLNRTNGMPVTGVDISGGPHNGTIYVNWSDKISEEDTDIFIAKSTDQGKTWSTPLRVNTDTTKTHQFLTWMSVDAVTGIIYIVYYDRSASTTKDTAVTLSISEDGGTTFKSQTISQKSFDPSGASFFGDYNCIHAYNGHVRPVWTHYENGKLSIRTALID